VQHAGLWRSMSQCNLLLAVPGTPGVQCTDFQRTCEQCSLSLHELLLLLLHCAVAPRAALGVGRRFTACIVLRHARTVGDTVGIVIVGCLAAAATTVLQQPLVASSALGWGGSSSTASRVPLNMARVSGMRCFLPPQPLLPPTATARAAAT
jgi:hypothetical protein